MEPNELSKLLDQLSKLNNNFNKFLKKKAETGGVESYDFDLDDAFEKSSNIKQNFDEIVKNLVEQQDLQKKIVKLTGDTYSETESQLELEKRVLSAVQSRIKALAEAGKINDEETKQLAGQEQQLRKGIEAREELLRLQEQGQGSLEKAAQAFGATLQVQNTRIGAMSNSIIGIGLNIGDALKEGIDFGEVLLSVIEGLVAVVSSIAEKIIESSLVITKKLFDIRAELTKVSGVNNKYNQILRETSLESLRFGVGIDEAGAAIGGLQQNMSSFVTLSKDAQKDLSVLASKLSVLGVDVAVSARNFDNFTRILRMNGNQIDKLVTDITEFGYGIGLSAEQTNQALAESGDLFVKYGNTGVAEFKRLLKSSKELGVGLKELTGIAAGFDTFEGAAEKAGKLNAILGGGYLNSVELLTASESERIEMLREGLALSGRSFDLLGRFEKQAIASAAGISSLTDAQKIFGDGSVEISETQQDFNKILEKSQTLGKKLEMLFQSFAVTLEGPIDMFSSFIDVIIIVNNKIGEVGRTLVVLGAIFGAGALAIGKFIKAKRAAAAAMEAINAITKVNTTLEGINTATKEAAAAAEALKTNAQAAGIPVQQASNKAIGAGVIKILMFAGAIALAGIGIGAAAFGIANLVSSFKDLNSEQIAASFVAITIAVAGLTFSMFALSAAIGAISAVAMGSGPGLLIFLGILAAISLTAIAIGFAFNQVTESIKALAETLSEATSPIEGKLKIQVAKENLEQMIGLVSDNETNVEVLRNITNPAGVAPAGPGAPAAPLFNPQIVNNIQAKITIDGTELRGIIKAEIEKSKPELIGQVATATSPFSSQ